MQRWLRLSVCVITVVSLAIGPLGCRTSSHKSVRIYEYDDQPQEDRQQSDELDSEYKMVSPGEMVGPGEMTDD